MRFFWQNTNFSYESFDNFFQITGNKISDKDLGCVWTSDKINFIQTKNAWLLYTGVVFINNMQEWAENLDIDNISHLHQQLSNIDGQFAMCLVTASSVTLVQDYFGTRPFAYYIKNTTICVSNVPGCITNIHSMHYNTPRNSIWSFETKSARLLLQSNAYQIDYTVNATEEDFLQSIIDTGEKLFKYKSCGISLSSGFDSGMIDCISCNSSTNIKAIASATKLEDKNLLSKRYEYRKKLHKNVPTKIFETVEIDYETAKNNVEKYSGIYVKDELSYVRANFEIAKFFKAKECQVHISGLPKFYMSTNWVYERSQIYPNIKLSKTRWNNFKFPEDMRLILENTPLSMLDLRFHEWHSVDVIPFLYHDIDTYFYYIDFNIFQTWVKLPASVKNQNKMPNNQLKNTSYSADAVWVCKEIMKKFKYPYKDNPKIGGPYV